MGSPLSPIIADIVLQDIECRAIQKLPNTLNFYYRYVDDILLAAPRSDIDEILTSFNSIHERLKFTLEIGENNKINFLNVSILVKNDHIIFDLYCKPTFSGRFLNFHSHHPTTHKKGTVIGMVDRVLSLSHPQFYQKNLINTINLLLNNNYPLQFIFNTIRNRIKHHFFKKSNNITPDTEVEKKFFVIPYIKNVSEKFKFINSEHDCKIAYTCKNNLSNIIKTGKDILDRVDNCNVVYKIQCHNCESSYVGQTKRKLSTRVKEHRKDINKKSGSPSTISQHRIDLGHDFNWNDVKILDKEPVYNKRLISEMLHIRSQTNSLNKQEDTEQLPDSYLPIMNLFPP